MGSVSTLNTYYFLPLLSHQKEIKKTKEKKRKREKQRSYLIKCESDHHCWINFQRGKPTKQK